MSILTFVTLAISELNPTKKDFNIIALEMQSQNIVPFNLTREQIISPKGDVYWDIGFLTTVTGSVRPKYPNNENSLYVLDGQAMLGANKLSELKQILDAKSINPYTFFDNPKIRFCVLKIDKVDDILTYQKNSEGDDRKHYISVYINSLPAYRNPKKLLNKDYRWVTFWNWICKIDAFEEKKKKYLNLLNRRYKYLYLIVYRHQFKHGVNFWIVGMHWL